MTIDTFEPIELYGPGDTNPFRIKQAIFKRIVIAGKNRLAHELNDTLAYAGTAADQEDYAEVLAILEGAATDARIIVEAIQAADGLHTWIDELGEERHNDTRTFCHRLRRSASSHHIPTGRPPDLPAAKQTYPRRGERGVTRHTGPNQRQPIER